MKVKYIGTEKEVMFRDVIFKKDKVVDLSENESLFKKLSVLEYFEVIPEVETTITPEVVVTPEVVPAPKRIIKKRTRKVPQVDPADLFSLGID